MYFSLAFFNCLFPAVIEFCTHTVFSILNLYFRVLFLFLQADSLSLGTYENDPSVGKYVNQDGLQQLRHYLKVGPYKSYLNGQPKNAFYGYVRQVMLNKSKRNAGSHESVRNLYDFADDSRESLRTFKIAADLANANVTSSRRRKRPRVLEEFNTAATTNQFNATQSSCPPSRSSCTDATSSGEIEQSANTGEK